MSVAALDPLAFRGDVASRTAPAVASGETSVLSYGELADLISHTSRALADEGVTAGDIVPLAIPHGTTDAIVALFAIWRNGGAAAALDTGWPAARMKDAIGVIGARILVCADELTEYLRTVGFHPSLRILSVRELLDRTVKHRETTSTITERQTAYVAFTSGSTGVPKAVMVPKKTVANFIHWECRNSRLPSGARTLQYAPLAFDVAYQEILSTFASGGCLVVPLAPRHDFAELWSEACSEQVARMFLPPVALQELAVASNEMLKSDQLSELTVAGEQLLITPEIRQFFRRHSGLRLRNHYGPTETHVATALELPEDADSWPTRPGIGVEIDGAAIHLLDDDLEPVAEGESGEIFIGGIPVGIGYCNDASQTAERFVADPFSNVPGSRLYRTGDLARRGLTGFEFLGRRDSQVKIRGYRVELQEIEAALLQLDGVRAAAVVAVGSSSVSQRLVAYIVAETPTVDSPRGLLASALPEYMVPSEYQFVASIPLTSTGKIDRSRLAREAALTTVAQPNAPDQRVAAASPLAGRISEIWSELLGVESIDEHSDFFAIGGHSVLAAQAITRLRRATGTQIPLRLLFEAPTLGEFATAVAELVE